MANWNISLVICRMVVHSVRRKCMKRRLLRRLLDDQALDETITLNYESGDFEFEHIGIYSNVVRFNIRNIVSYGE